MRGPRVGGPELGGPELGGPELGGRELGPPISELSFKVLASNPSAGAQSWGPELGGPELGGPELGPLISELSFKVLARKNYVTLSAKLFREMQIKLPLLGPGAGAFGHYCPNCTPQDCVSTTSP